MFKKRKKEDYIVLSKVWLNKDNSLCMIFDGMVCELAAKKGPITEEANIGFIKILLEKIVKGKIILDDSVWCNIFFDVFKEVADCLNTINKGSGTKKDKVALKKNVLSETAEKLWPVIKAFDSTMLTQYFTDCHAWPRGICQEVIITSAHLDDNTFYIEGPDGHALEIGFEDEEELIDIIYEFFAQFIFGEFLGDDTTDFGRKINELSNTVGDTINSLEQPEDIKVCDVLIESIVAKYVEKTLIPFLRI